METSDMIVNAINLMTDYGKYGIASVVSGEEEKKAYFKRMAIIGAGAGVGGAIIGALYASLAKRSVAGWAIGSLIIFGGLGAGSVWLMQYLKEKKA